MDSPVQRQAWTGAAVLIIAAFGAGYLTGAHGGMLPIGSAPPGAIDGDLACWFSPHGGCTDAVVNEIEHATRSVHVLSYTFTSHPIADALIAAHQRGLDVTVVVDKSEQHDIHSQAPRLARAGIPVYVDSQHAIAHNKVMVMDGDTVITGSFNWTHAAEYENADNLLIIHAHPAISAAYEANFEHHLGHSDRMSD